MQSTYAQPGHTGIVEARVLRANDGPDPEATQLEAILNRARSQSEEAARLVTSAEQLIARLTGMGLEEQKAAMQPMPCGVIPQFEAYQSDTDRALGALNSLFERLQRLI